MLFLSLLFHDDYGGGEYFFNIHLGFPFSWRDGSLDFGPAVQQGISLEEHMVLHPEEIYWWIDFPALIADLFFWINLGILMTTFCKVFLIPLFLVACGTLEVGK